MQTFFSKCFSENNIDLYGYISLSDCEIRKPYLLEKTGIKNGTVIMIAVPYFTQACLMENRNVSAYAVSRDYHGFYRNLFENILPLLRAEFPNEQFEGFADHSPIAELQAAAMAGLGVIGNNGLLITEKYSSYVFLGEIITTAILPTKKAEMKSCCGCGACQKACPMDKIGTCLSALTQKKGQLTPDEEEILLTYGSVWGCDICQEVCPHTKRAIQNGTIFSPIPYFQSECIPFLKSGVLAEMDDSAFLSRAYSWRGRETIQRNLTLFEDFDKKGGKKEC